MCWEVFCAPLAAYAAHAYAKKPPVSPAVRAEISAASAAAAEAYRLPAPIAFDILRLDELERYVLDELVPVHLPVTHRFTPSLYSREIFMPGPRDGRSGTLLASRLHITTHQYVVLSGVADVLIPGEEPVRLTAGHVGITEAGTRRGLYILEDCRWITYHALTAEEEALRSRGAPEQEMVAAVEARIIGSTEQHAEIFEGYKGKLAAAGLPGPHDGTPQLQEGKPWPGQS